MTPASLALDPDPADPPGVDDTSTVRRGMHRRRPAHDRDRDRLDRFVTGPQITRVTDGRHPASG